MEYNFQNKSTTDKLSVLIIRKKKVENQLRILFSKRDTHPKGVSELENELKQLTQEISTLTNSLKK